MKQASQALIDLLAGTNQFVMWDVYTITLADGSVLTYSSGDTSGVRSFIERFVDGLSPYSLVTGTWVPFSIVAGYDGDSIKATTSATVNDNSTIQRLAGPLTATRVAAKFRIISFATDDAMSVAFYNGAAWQFIFNPRREDAFDALRRAHLYLNGSEYIVSTAALAINTWYEVVVQIVAGAGNTICVIRTVPDNVVVYSTVIGPAVPELDVTALRFIVDDADRLSETEYDDVSINY